MMWMYGVVLAAVLVVSSPWWIMRMLTTERYREGMRERLGGVPERLRAAVAGFAEQRRVVWVHAVSVGEVLAASRLVGELEAALGGGDQPWRVVVSTTTRTGQKLARERFGAERVFYFPLDFASSVRAYLRVLNPAALVLMESELWPRILYECGRGGVPVVVVNARVSDRSFARGMKVRAVWGRVLRKVSLWLAQSEEDARRLVAMGARAENVRAIGNLKYDVRAPKESRVAELIKEAAGGRPIMVAGSTVDGANGEDDEERTLVATQQECFPGSGSVRPLLVLAPRHPERFSGVEAMLRSYKYVRVSDWRGNTEPSAAEIVLLDTIGDLSAVYGIADVAFVGGSLVNRGGHNPLEPAQFGVPVVIGKSYENFRDITGRMMEAKAIGIVEDDDELDETLINFLSDRERARAMGERGRKVFEAQQGATQRAVEAIVEVIRTGAKA